MPISQISAMSARAEQVRQANSAASMGGKMRQIFAGQNLCGCCIITIKKAARLLRSGGLQLPRREANADFDFKLSQDGVFVKKIGEKAPYDLADMLACLIFSTGKVKAGK
jgi:hypothetical protein